MELPFTDEAHGLKQTQFFGGRDNLTRYFKGFLEHGTQGVSTIDTWIVEGERGLGKSSFGDWCYDVGRKNEYTCTIHIKLRELRGKHTGSVEEIPTPSLYTYIVRESYRAEETVGLFVKPFKYLKYYSWIVTSSILNNITVQVLGLSPTNNLLKWFVPTNIKSFSKKLNQVFELHRVTTTHLVVIIDEMSHEVSNGEVMILRLMRELEEYLTRDRIINQRILFVLLLHPTWEKIYNDNRIRIDNIKLDRLQPFDYAEFMTYVERRATQTGWSFSEDFVKGLFIMSGGIPVTFQNLGLITCKSINGKREVTVKDLIACINDNKVGKSIQFFFSGWINEGSFKVNSELEFRMLEQFKEHGNIHYDDPAWVNNNFLIEGLTKEQWQGAVYTQLGISAKKAESRKTFDSLWNRMIKYKILVPVKNSENYRFASELLRINLHRFNKK